MTCHCARAARAALLLAVIRGHITPDRLARLYALTKEAA